MKEWTERESKFFNAWQLYNRKEFLKYYYGTYEDVTRVVRAFPEITFRHLISPRQDIETDLIPMFDSKEKIKGFFDIGYTDASSILDGYLSTLNETSRDQ